MSSRHDPHPIESMDGVQRRRFLGLAAFAATTVVGVGIAGPAQAAPGAATDRAFVVDPDTGWPIYAGSTPPAGYSRHHLPCDRGQYVDVPDHAVESASHEALEVVHAPYRDFDGKGSR